MFNLLGCLVGLEPDHKPALIWSPNRLPPPARLTSKDSREPPEHIDWDRFLCDGCVNGIAVDFLHLTKLWPDCGIFKRSWPLKRVKSSFWEALIMFSHSDCIFVHTVTWSGLLFQILCSWYTHLSQLRNREDNFKERWKVHVLNPTKEAIFTLRFKVQNTHWINLILHLCKDSQTDGCDITAESIQLQRQTHVDHYIIPRLRRKLLDLRYQTESMFLFLTLLTFSALILPKDQRFKLVVFHKSWDHNPKLLIFHTRGKDINRQASRTARKQTHRFMLFLLTFPFHIVQIELEHKVIKPFNHFSAWFADNIVIFLLLFRCCY